MFGIFYTFIVGTAKLIWYGQRTCHNYRRRRRAKSNGHETYFDNNGAERLVSTNEQVHVHYKESDPYNDYVMQTYDGRIVHNYSQDTRDYLSDLNYRLAKLNGNTVYSKGETFNERSKHNNIYSLKKGDIYGNRYIDMKTGDEYVLRYIVGEGYYYMRVLDGMFVRKADMNIIQDIKDGKSEIDISLGEKAKAHNDEIRKSGYIDYLNPSSPGMCYEMDLSVPTKSWTDRKNDWYLKKYMTQEPIKYTKHTNIDSKRKGEDAYEWDY